VSAAIDPGAARVAAQWLVRLRDGALSTAEQQAFDAWRDSHPDHREAWRRAELVCQAMAVVPPALRQTRPHEPRRAAIKRLAMLIACAAPPLLLASRSPWWESWRAGVSTGTGEIRHMPLPDGTQLAMNTATAIDVAFDDTTRLIVLHAGEIHLRSAPDPATLARPLIVRTANGSVRAIGTRFAVRQEGGLFSPRTHVCVTQGAVEILPSQAHQAARTIGSGWQTSFDANAVAGVAAAPAGSEAWLQGVLIAERMPLGEVLAQLARYRQGVVRCDPAVARLPVDGIFQLSDTDKILALLQVSLPIRVSLRTPYWVGVGPA
jgi:transmembrane sensor